MFREHRAFGALECRQRLSLYDMVVRRALERSDDQYITAVVAVGREQVVLGDECRAIPWLAVEPVLHPAEGIVGELRTYVGTERLVETAFQRVHRIEAGCRQCGAVFRREQVKAEWQERRDQLVEVERRQLRD